MANTWTSYDSRWQALSDSQKAAVMSLMEAGLSKPADAMNAAGAMVNRSAMTGEPLGQHVSRRIYQPTIEPSQYARLGKILNSPQFPEMTSWVDRRLAGEIPDPVSGATHFLAKPQVMLALERQNPSKYKNWGPRGANWTGYDPATGRYSNQVFEDSSHAFLTPDGKGGAPANATYRVAAGPNSTGGAEMRKAVGSAPGTDDKYAKIRAALQNNWTAAPETPPVMQQQVQRTALPELPDASIRKLADSLMASGREMGRNARSPWEAIASVAQTGVGMYGANQADAKEKDYRKALTDALSNSSDTNSLISTMIGSGDPELQKAGLTMKLQQGIKDPKVQAEIAKLQAEARKYDAEATAKAEGRKDLTATELKALYGAEDSLPAIQGTLDSLDRAKTLSPQAYSGAAAGTRAWIMNRTPFVDSPDAKATEEMGKLLSLESIQAMSANLKGATTDFELRKFENILSDPSTPQDIRDRTIDRMRALAQRKLDLENARINELRGTGRAPGRGAGGPFVSPQTAQPAQAPAAPQAPGGGYSQLSDGEIAARLGLPAPAAPAQPAQAPQQSTGYLLDPVPGRVPDPEPGMWGRFVERVAPNFAQAKAAERSGATPMTQEEIDWWNNYWAAAQ